MKHAPIIPLFVALVSLLTASCTNQPTYRKDQLVRSVQDALVEEGLEQASVHLIDHTLAVQFAYPDTLSQMNDQVGFGEGFDEAARKAIGGLHRVLLSSDADVQFYVLLISDPEIPGIYLTMIRYMDDVRRSYVNMIDTIETFSRLVIDVNAAPPNQTLTLDQLLTRDIELSEFLSWQLAKRIQYRLTEALLATGRVQVGRCHGEFRNGEFLFTLNVLPVEGMSIEPEGEMLERAFDEATGVIAQVLSGYRFESFDTVRLIHPPTGRNLVLPRGQLEIFR